MGYLYQFLGSALHRVQASKGYGAVADAGDLTLHIETYGQDAAAALPDRIELIQFKFSQAAAPVAPSEFADILRALKTSEKQVGKCVLSVTWKLVTNRNLSDRTKALRDKRPGTKLGTTTQADATLIRKDGQRCGYKRRTLAGLHAALEERMWAFGEKAVASAKMRANSYLLSLVEKPEGSRIVEKDKLEEQLAGFPRPRSMRPEEFTGYAKEDLKRIIHELDERPIGDIVPREKVQQLFEIPGLAIAVITGHGGCGKTRSVLKALFDSLNDRHFLAGALMPGPHPRPESFEKLVNRWRSLDQLDPPETFDQSWERIRTASKGFGRPVIVIALDGIDEEGSDDATTRHVAELVSHFRRAAREVEPEGLLIVTCRVKETFDYYLKHEGTGGPESTGFQVFELGDFDGQEFVAVWENWFHGEPLPEVAQHAATAPVMGGPESVPSELRARIEALKHPALLGCARGLNNVERQQLFDGVDAVWVKLLSFYLDWFSHKAHLRKGYKEDRVQAVLKAVARACATLSPPVGTYDLMEHWVKPAVIDPSFGNEMVRDIFREAVSCGLVESPGFARYTMPGSVPVPWTWRFGFLQTHLAKLV